MLRKLALYSVVILLASIQLSYADGNSYTVNVPNNQNGYSAVVIQQSGNGFTGPQGEFYTQFPSVAQLQVMYGGRNTPNVGSSVTVTVAPPALPVYVQPDPPDPSFIWTPGYWRYDSFFEDYYWVPGTWVRAPTPGYLWTPGYWGWNSGVYVFNEGYWGPHIGFYGGINYGCGYGGHGFSGGGHGGGGWNKGASNNTTSFNGGPGGIQAKPTHEERAAMKERHIPATAQQRLQVQTARKNPALRASHNHGKPAIAATRRAGVFTGKGVVAARKAGAFYHNTKPIKPRVSGGNGNAHAKPNPKHKPKPKPKPKVVPPPNGNNPPTNNTQ